MRNEFHGLFLSPSGKELASLTSSYQNLITIVDTQTWQATRTLSDFQKKPGLGHIAIIDVHYTRDGKFLVATNAVGMIMFWDTRDYREVLWARLQKTGSTTFTFASDGKTMLSTSSDGASLTYAPDGKPKFSYSQHGDDDGMVKVWDMKDFIERMPSRNVPPPKIVPRVQPRAKSRATEGK